MVLGIIAAVGYGIFLLTTGSGTTLDPTLTHTVARRNLRDTVIEQGTIQSRNTVKGRCKIPGSQNKIIFIVPEGTHVKEGDLVVRFDPNEIEQLVAEKRILTNTAKGKVEQAEQQLAVQKNKNESDIAAAELALTLARLDLEKYRDGDYNAELADLGRSIAEGEAELKKNQDELENLRDLVKKGIRTSVQLRELELRVNSAQYRLDRDKQKLVVLREYDFKRKITEFKAKAVEAERKLARAKTTADAEIAKAESALANAEIAYNLEKRELEQYEETLSHTEIKASKAGTVAYANRPWFDDNERIREGATVHRRQDIFYLPDMRNMKVQVDIHESVVNKVKKGQPVIVRVDAFPDQVFQARVERIANLATSSRSASRSYSADIVIEEFPEGTPLKPGMTAEVEIMVGNYNDIIAVPVNAVTEHFQKTYAFVKTDSGFEQRNVKVGRSTHSFVEVLDGLAIDDIVALDAYQRGLAEFGDAEKDPGSADSEQRSEKLTRSDVTP